LEITMQLIYGTNILLTRGDSFSKSFTVKNNGEVYTPTAEDTIVFKLKKAYTDKNALITKTIDYETLKLELDPADTGTLAFGDYVYNIEITTADGGVHTIIVGVLRLMEET